MSGVNNGQQQFDTVLVANRGEIACRVLRTVRAMGLASVAVYSEADADAPHVGLADRSVCIGPPSVAESYLCVDRILEAAQATGADAVHPGYGFLAENSVFATACATAGIVFIGPSPRAIEMMGNKAVAKRLMLAAGVPCVPGYEGEDQSDATLIAAGQSIGFPVMVKAAAGGGGRGMRLVASADDLPGAIELARSEAANAFGSGDLILEKAVVRSRHVEIQVMADAAGHTVHLGERDCSIQRRHQKIVEEAPCPVLTADLRQEMGEAAVRVAEAVDYQGAGTVEFLLDADGNFYFLEMNTRLQVEHPVTELVTGLDLVELQIRIARGEPLELTQDAVGMNGHAIEARLYTEDPARDFMPTTGTLALWRPAANTDVRIDDGIRSGQVISPYYDAMAAKVIAWGATRDVARRRLIAALQDTVLFGPQTNKAFLIQCLMHDRFARGEATTTFIADEMQTAARDSAVATSRDAVVAGVLYFCLARAAALHDGCGISHTLLNWSSGIRLAAHLGMRSGETDFDVSVLAGDGERYVATVEDHESVVEMTSMDAGSACVAIDGCPLAVTFRERRGGELWISTEGKDHFFNRIDAGATDSDRAGGGGRINAAMHGVVQDIVVAVGDHVEQGQRLLVMEAMKMQQEVLSPVAGEVDAIHAHTGQQVATGDLLLTIDEDG